MHFLWMAALHSEKKKKQTTKRNSVRQIGLRKDMMVSDLAIHIVNGKKILTLTSALIALLVKTPVMEKKKQVK